MMPLYEFVCDGCGDKYERNVPVDKRDLFLYSCYKCGGSYKRRFGIGTIVIK